MTDENKLNLFIALTLLLVYVGVWLLNQILLVGGLK
jgi:hypothetical protein